MTKKTTKSAVESTNDLQQKDLKVNIIAEQILEGVCRKDIERFCERDLKLSKYQIPNYIADASKRITDLFNERFEGKLPSIASGFQVIYERAMRDSDYKSANEALKNLANLMGLMKVKTENKTEITTSESLKDLPTDELIRLVKGAED